MDQFSNINISAIKVEPSSQAEGMSLIDIDLRRKTGVTLLAIKRGTDIIEHPVPETVFLVTILLMYLGNPEQVNFASELLITKNE